MHINLEWLPAYAQIVGRIQTPIVIHAEIHHIIKWADICRLQIPAYSYIGILLKWGAIIHSTRSHRFWLMKTAEMSGFVIKEEYELRKFAVGIAKQTDVFNEKSYVKKRCSLKSVVKNNPRFCSVARMEH